MKHITFEYLAKFKSSRIDDRADSGISFSLISEAPTDHSDLSLNFYEVIETRKMATYKV